jgi:hypothetical protein
MPLIEAIASQSGHKNAKRRQQNQKGFHAISVWNVAAAVNLHATFTCLGPGKLVFILVKKETAMPQSAQSAYARLSKADQQAVDNVIVGDLIEMQVTVLAMRDRAPQISKDADFIINTMVKRHLTGTPADQHAQTKRIEAELEKSRELYATGDALISARELARGVSAPQLADYSRLVQRAIDLDGDQSPPFASLKKASYARN